MLVFKNKKHYLKAKAWHDHGHDNNPKVPHGKTQEAQVVLISMTELQGAVNFAIK